MPFEYFGNNVLGIALTLPRIVAAFLALPLLSSSTMPPLVRNSFFVSLAIVVFPLGKAIEVEENEGELEQPPFRLSDRVR